MLEVGTAVDLDFAATADGAVLADATVTLAIDLPTGAVLSPALTVARLSVGRYRVIFTPTLPGRHVLRWTASGAVSKRRTDVLNVVSSSGSSAIISLDEAREHINMPDDVHVEDGELRSFIEAASGIVEQHLGEIVARRVITETHQVRSGQPMMLRPPILRLVAVTADDAEVDPAGLVVDGFTGFVTGTVGTVEVSYEAGMAEVPRAYITATQIICAHLWATQRPNTFSSSPSFGGDTGTAVAGMGYALPNRAAELLGGRAPNVP